MQYFSYIKQILYSYIKQIYFFYNKQTVCQNPRILTHCLISYPEGEGY